jgi:hypothetical protein
MIIGRTWRLGVAELLGVGGAREAGEPGPRSRTQSSLPLQDDRCEGRERTSAELLAAFGEHEPDPEVVVAALVEACGFGLLHGRSLPEALEQRFNGVTERGYAMSCGWSDRSSLAPGPGARAQLIQDPASSRRLIDVQRIHYALIQLLRSWRCSFTSLPLPLGFARYSRLGQGGYRGDRDCIHQNFNCTLTVGVVCRELLVAWRPSAGTLRYLLIALNTIRVASCVDEVLSDFR